MAVYAPTEEASYHEKDTFYARLEQVLSLSHRKNLLLCLGDFNAVSGTARSSVIGPSGSGIPNDNTDCLLGFCSGNGLRICGSWFQWRDIHRVTWFSNDGHTAKEIDHVLCNSRWRAVQQCRVYRSMEFDTDHRPVVATVALKLKRSQKREDLAPHYNICRLVDPVI